MELSWAAQRYLTSQWALDPDDEEAFIRKVNAMSNYEFLQLLDGIFDRDAVREVLRP